MKTTMQLIFNFNPGNRVIFLMTIWSCLYSPLTSLALTPQETMPVLVRELAENKAELEQCVESYAFQKLGKTEFTYWISGINSNIERLINSMHDSPKGRILFVSFNITYAQATRILREKSRRSSPLDQHRKINSGGLSSIPELEKICNKVKFTQIEKRVNNISSAINKYL
jgi:hypothetical protein